jgi:hypothetical protein
MATVTKGRTFVSGEVVTPTKLNTLVDSATVTQIQTADISDAQITTAKIADANVTTAKLADGSVTPAKLNSTVIMVPTGAVMPFAMNSAPTGWLAANGGEYSKTGTYATLFAAIGVTYGETNGAGGTGTTHFRVPDLRGYFVRGAGTNSDTTAAGAFGVKQADAFQGHAHSTNGNAFWVNGGGAVLGGSGISSTVALSVGSPISDGTNGTPRTASETRPANIAMLYCIKF